MPSPDRTFTKVTLAELAVGAILDALPRMPGGDESDQPVTVVIEGGKLLLRSRPQCSDEWTEIPVPDVSVTGPDQRVCLNRTFITKALRFGFTEFEVQDALEPSPVHRTGKEDEWPCRMRFDDAPATAQANSQPSQPSPQEATKPTEAADLGDPVRRSAR